MTRQSEGSRTASSADPQPIEEAWAASVLPQREEGAHKWSVGGVVVVAGSPSYAGAAALCCAAAGRTGAGIVSAALPRSIARVVVGLVPEVTVVMLPDGESPSIAQRASDAIEKRLERSGSLVVGPGLGDDDETAALLSALFGFTRPRGVIGFGVAQASGETTGPQGAIARTGKPVVADADALNWLAKQEAWWERVPAGTLVVTPHPAEMARLTGQETADVLANPAAVAGDAAVRWRQTIVLKGGHTIVATPEGELFAAETPPALATAGSGDVLSGAIGAFLAQGLTPSVAARLAVFVGGRAAQRVSRRFGALGLIASDLPPAMAEELCDLEGMGT